MSLKVIGRGLLSGRETSRIPHFLGSLLMDGYEVISLTRRPPFTSGKFLALISCRDFDEPNALIRIERIGHLQNAVMPS
jgi:hypothetical protein